MIMSQKPIACFNSGIFDRLHEYRFRPVRADAQPDTLQAPRLIKVIWALVLLLILSASDAPGAVIHSPTDAVALKVGFVKEVFLVQGQVQGLEEDIARYYTRHLGADFRPHYFSNADAALVALRTGQIDLVLGEQVAGDGVVGQDVHCEGSNLHMTVLDFHATQAKEMARFFCQAGIRQTMMHLEGFHATPALDGAYQKWHFYHALDTRLPNYRAHFEAAAKDYTHDWAFLAAIGYQESHLSPKAVSPTGVAGLMMLTQPTATAMGVSDRTDAHQSISGGARYLEDLEQMFGDVEPSERPWFVLAAYNMGPFAVSRIQKMLTDEGKNPNRWVNVYAYLKAHSKDNARYRQCLHYVGNIRIYLEGIHKMHAV